MRPAALFALVTLATSASACVEGAGSSYSNGCVRSVGPSCQRQLHAANAPRCSPFLKAVPAHCDIRGLVQVHIVAFTKFEIPSPLTLVTAQVLLPSGPALRKSSIGSPETDRGPPFS